jgi:hypothetical protein
MVNRSLRVILLTAVGAAATGAAARAAGLAPDQARGVAAARGDAYLNLSEVVLGLPMRTGGTLARYVARRGSDREQIEAAIRGAYLVGEPSFEPPDVAHVTVEVEAEALPYAVRAQMRNLPPVIQADGAADIQVWIQTDQQDFGTVPDVVRQWAEKTLEAEGSATLGAKFRNVEPKVRAAREARSRALTKLSAEVHKLLLDPDVTVAAWLAAHPQLRPGLEAVVAGASLAKESVEGGTYRVTVTLPGRRLLVPLRQGRFRAPIRPKLSDAQVALARGNAVQVAKKRLLARIGTLPLTTGAPASTLLAEEDTLRRDVERLVRLTPFRLFEIAPSGLAKVHVALAARDLPRGLRRRLGQRAPTVLFVLGGGRPVAAPGTQRAKPEDVVLAGTGVDAIKTYTDKGLTQGQALILARKGATVAAQKDLAAQYAARMRLDEQNAKKFLKHSARVIANAGDTVPGVQVVGDSVTPDQLSIKVVVQARVGDLQKAFGEPKPEG